MLKIGAEDAQVSVQPEDEISVVLPTDLDPAQVDVLGAPGRLFFYDWEANLVPNPDTPASQPKGEAGFARLYDAVQLASEQQPESDKKCADTCTFAGERYYLFDENSLEPLAGPVAEESDLYNPASGNDPGSGVVLEVPQGTVVVAEPVVDDSGGGETGDEYFVLHDEPALSGEETANAEPGTDPVTNQPNVSFDFTETGQSSWESLTLEVAERGRAEAPPVVATDQQAQAVSQHIALVLDTLVVTRPIINFVSNPAGIDGSTGAQISGGMTLAEAERLAAILQIGPLPVEVTLESREPVAP